MVTTTPTFDLPAQWPRQILAHRDPQSVAARKGFVAASFIDQANLSSALVDIENLLVVLLYEDEFRSVDGRSPARTAAARRLSGESRATRRQMGRRGKQCVIQGLDAHAAARCPWPTN